MNFKRSRIYQFFCRLAGQTEEIAGERFSGRVMVVNAPPLFQTDLRRYLEDRGIVVQPHRSSRVALRYARRSTPDLAIVYAVESIRKGLRVCRQLRGVPSILVGSLDSAPVASHADDGYPIDYYCKSNGTLELAGQITERLKHGRNEGPVWVQPT